MTKLSALQKWWWGNRVPLSTKGESDSDDLEGVC